MSIDAAGVLPALLAALYGSVDGDIIVRSDAAESTITSAADAVEFAEYHGGVIQLFLATRDGQAGARALWADEVTSDMGEPDYLLCQTEEDRYDERIAIFIGAGEAVLESIPLPGTGGWALDGESISKLGDGVVRDASPHQVEEPAGSEVDEEARLHDAVFPGGFPDDDLINMPMKIGFGTGRADKRWPARDVRFGDIIHLMSKHEVGAKDGKAFLQGTGIQGQRTAKAMDALYLCGLDVDSGFSLDWALNRIQNELKLAAIIYTTHSNMKPVTHVMQSSYAKWAKKMGKSVSEPTDMDMQTYLHDSKGWERSIAMSAKVGETVHELDGVAYTVEHIPMPKFRIVFPLALPFVISKQAGLMQVEAINLWKGRVLGLAKIVGVPIDESCLDPSRLFYLPRHPEGMGFRVIVTNGAALDFEAVPDANPRKADELEADVFERAAKALGSSSKPLMFGDFSLKRWAMSNAGIFQPAEMLQAVAPDRVRMNNNTGKIEIECPFDHEHSNAGDPEDRACFVIDAHSDSSAGGFAWGCQHHNCRSRDRLEFMCQALEAQWFTIADITDERYLAVTVEEHVRFVDPIQAAKELLQRIEIVDPKDSDTPTEVEDILREAAKCRLSPIQVEAVITAMNAKALGKTRTMMNSYKQFRAQEDMKENPDEKLARLMKKDGIDSGGRLAKQIDHKMGYNEQKKFLRERLDYLNGIGKTTMFDYGGAKFFCEMISAYNDTRMKEVDWTMLSNFLSEHVSFIKVIEDNAQSIPLPDRILKELAIDHNWYCPILNGFSTLPYYRKAGGLVSTQGYDIESGLYLKPRIKETFNVPVNPTPKQVKVAVDLFTKGVYANFPFDDGPESDSKGAGSRANFMALLLQPFIRAMVEGPTPIYLIMKPTPGTGASLLVSTALMINTGFDDPASQTATANEEELRKNITSAFRGGQTFYWIDNITVAMASPAYANLATAGTWEDRMLGRSEMVKYPNTLQFIVGGNNPRGTYEIMRRCLPIRLDAKRDPRARSEKSFKFFPLAPYVREHRKELIEALLTMINAWIAAGKPDFSGKPLMSFESWSKITGGILENAGIEGFLSNLDLTQKLADDETRAWESVFQEVANNKKGGVNRPLRLAEVAEMISEMPEFPAIGLSARYADADPKTLAPHLRTVFDGKLGAPYRVFVSMPTGKKGEDGKPELIEREMSLKIARQKDARSAQVTYRLIEALD